MTVTPTFQMSGSILAGTAEHRLTSMTSDLAIEANHDPETIGAIVAQAEKMCFVLDAVEQPHTVARTTTLNGASL